MTTSYKVTTFRDMGDTLGLRFVETLETFDTLDAAMRFVSVSAVRQGGSTFLPAMPVRTVRDNGRTVTRMGWRRREVTGLSGGAGSATAYVTPESVPYAVIRAQFAVDTAETPLMFSQADAEAVRAKRAAMV